MNHVEDYLPEPPPGCYWVTNSVEVSGTHTPKSHTARFTLMRGRFEYIGTGQIAVDLYGWGAIRERALAIIAKATGTTP